MFPSVHPTTTAAWKKLQAHIQYMQDASMKEMFADDPDRFSKFSIFTDDLVFDYSKNIITDQTLQQLFDLAEECKVKDAIEAMFNGEAINQTENRSVLHVALRNFSGRSIQSDGKDVMPDVQKVLKQMKDFCERDS